MKSKAYLLLLWPLLWLPLLTTGCQDAEMPATPEVDVDRNLSQDGLDNDNDGTIDEPDETAVEPSDSFDATSDGVDNDNDGTIDEPGETAEDGS